MRSSQSPVASVPPCDDRPTPNFWPVAQRDVAGSHTSNLPLPVAVDVLRLWPLFNSLGAPWNMKYRGSGCKLPQTCWAIVKRQHPMLWQLTSSKLRLHPVGDQSWLSRGLLLAAADKVNLRCLQQSFNTFPSSLAVLELYHVVTFMSELLNLCLVNQSGLQHGLSHVRSATMILQDCQSGCKHHTAHLRTMSGCWCPVNIIAFCTQTSNYHLLTSRLSSIICFTSNHKIQLMQWSLGHQTPRPWSMARQLKVAELLCCFARTSRVDQRSTRKKKQIDRERLAQINLVQMFTNVRW